MAIYPKKWLAATCLAITALIGLNTNLQLIHSEAFSSSPADGQNCVSPPANMVSWWPGDEDAIDLMGSNNGVTQNGVTFAPGMVRSAFQLDGVDDYVAVPDASSLQIANALTVDAWIKPSSLLQAYAPLVKKPGTGNNSGYALEFLFNNVTFWVYVNGTGWVNSPWVPVPVGEWSHVAGVYDGSVVSLYVNGNLIGSPTSAPGSIVVPNGELHIGHDPANTTRFYHGLIDEVELFNRALSASEIQAIYTANSAGKCAFGQKAVNTTTAFHGSPLTYTISLNNMGLVAPGNIMVTDTVPLSLTYSTDSLSATTGSYAYHHGVITWTGTVTASEFVTITFGAYVSQTVPIGASLVNSAVINREGTVITRTATVTISAPPIIGISPVSLLSAQKINLQLNQTLTVSNTGGANLSWTVTEHTGPSCTSPAELSWISVTPLSGILSPANQSPLQVTFDSTSLAAGTTSTGALCFTSNDPNSPQVTVPLTLQVLQFKLHLPLIIR
ncbi:hypothetical protein TFLX_01247 [Thermoflexales bacterium]|nr:hypothetical protein TFLX_01247 [Thermoflexales bacterium]